MSEEAQFGCRSSGDLLRSRRARGAFQGFHAWTIHGFRQNTPVGYAEGILDLLCLNASHSPPYSTHCTRYTKKCKGTVASSLNKQGTVQPCLARLYISMLYKNLYSQNYFLADFGPLYSAAYTTIETVLTIVYNSLRVHA